MINIIRNEWKIFFRNKVFIYSTIFFVLSLIVIVLLGISQNKNQIIYQNKAQDHIRQKWENLEAMNPHRAAHYGSYALKSFGTRHNIYFHRFSSKIKISIFKSNIFVCF